MILARDAAPLMSGSCDEQAVLSGRYESSLETPEIPLSQQNRRLQSRSLHARYSRAAVTIAILLWFGEHESGMEVIASGVVKAGLRPSWLHICKKGGKGCSFLLWGLNGR